MTEALIAKDRQSRRDSVKETLQVDVDHILPIADRQVVEGSYRADAGIANEDIKLAKSLAGQTNEASQVISFPHIRRRIYTLATRDGDAIRERLQ